MVAATFVEWGWGVFLPVIHDQPVDLVATHSSGAIERIQVKTAHDHREDSSRRVVLRRGKAQDAYGPDDFSLVVAWDLEKGEGWVREWSELLGRVTISVSKMTPLEEWLADKEVQ